jgi:hypothetical protein
VSTPVILSPGQGACAARGNSTSPSDFRSRCAYRGYRFTAVCRFVRAAAREIALRLLRLPRSRCAYRGYRFTAVCRFVARARRFQKIAGACAAGNSTAPAQTSRSLRLPGLQVHRRLPFCRPGKYRRFTAVCRFVAGKAARGNSTAPAQTSRSRCAYRGYRFTAVCRFVARARRLRRGPGNSTAPAQTSRSRCAYRGYRFTAVCRFVARARRLRRGPGK